MDDDILSLLKEGLEIMDKDMQTPEEESWCERVTEALTK